MLVPTLAGLQTNRGMGTKTGRFGNARGNRGQKSYGSDTHFAPVLHLAEEILLREAMFMRRRAVES